MVTNVMRLIGREESDVANCWVLCLENDRARVRFSSRSRCTRFAPFSSQTGERRLV